MKIKIIVLIVSSLLTTPLVAQESSPDAKQPATKGPGKGEPLHIQWIRKAGQTYKVRHIEERDRRGRGGNRIQSRQDCTYNAKVLSSAASGVEVEWVLQSCVVPDAKLAALPESDQKAIRYVFQSLKGLRFHFLIDPNEKVHLKNTNEVAGYFRELKKLLLDYQKKEGASKSALAMMSSMLNAETFAQIVKQEQYLLLRPTNIQLNIGEMQQSKTKMEMLIGDPIPMQVEYGILSYDPKTDLAVVVFNQVAHEKDIKVWLKGLSEKMGKPLKEEELQKIKGARIHIRYRALVYASTGWVKEVQEESVSSVPGMPGSSKTNRLQLSLPNNP